MKRIVETIEGKGKLKKFKNKEVLLNEGDCARNLYYIKSGALRLYFNKDGADITFQFFFEGHFVSSFDSLTGNTPSLFTLQAIEQTEVVVLPKEEFQSAVEKDLDVRKFYEETLIERFRNYQMLFLSLIKDTPQERYEKLLKEHPEILKRVPQHYIASYLGVTPVSLSRIRSRLS